MRGRFIKGLIVIFLLLFTNFLFAQKDDLKFIHLSTENGLSNSESNVIIQDKEGFIWIGTSDGLNRYDGRTFKVYRKIANDSTSIQHNNIKCLFLDSKGQLWVGTDRGGVSRYIKERDCFVNYLSNLNDSNSIISTKVTGIAEDCDHQIWVASFGGLNLFNPKKNNFIRFSDNPVMTVSDQGLEKLRKQIGYKVFMDFLESKRGQKIPYNNIYYYLRYLNKDSTDKYFDFISIALNDKGITSADLRCLTSDKYGNIIIGYWNGLISLLNPKTRTFSHYKFIRPKERGFIDFFITSLCVDGDKIWVSTRGEGIWIFNTGTRQWRKFDKLNEQFVNTIVKDQNNNIWIGGANCGLVQYNSKADLLTFYKHDENDRFSLSSNTVSCIYEDRQHNLWVGSVQSDLNFSTKRNPFHAFKQGLLNSGEHTLSNVSSIMEEDDNTLWIGYYNVGGIDVINRNTFQKRHISPKQLGLGEGSVQCIFKDSHSNIWVGTYLGGLQLYDKKNNRFVSYLHNPADSKSISGNDVRRIVEDKGGNLWVAIHGGGIDKFNPITKQFQHFRANYVDKQKSLRSDWVFTVYCDKEDNIWVGSIEGVSVIDKKTLNVKQYFNDPKKGKSLSNNFVLAIFQDSKGDMWFGTSNGLNLFDPKTETFKSFTRKDGLPNDNITGILEDDNANLWISTFKGLSRYSLKEHTFKNFEKQDGLVSDEFFVQSAFKAKNGDLFFGGREGPVGFNPENVTDNNYLPPVYITDFKLFNQSVEIAGTSKKKGFFLENQITFTKELSLSYSQNVFTFEFVALNYVRPEKNQFAYMMEGFDKQWNIIGRKNDVTYTNLQPGVYTFRVKASNNDGRWNETGTSVKLIITPPWWKTIWAYMGYSLLCVILLLFLRYSILQRERFRRKLEMERMEAKKLHEVDLMKLRFFTNISHEFRTPLTLILAPLEKPFQLLNPEKLEMTYKLIYRNASRLLRLINQLMDVKKLEVGGLKLEASQKDIVPFVKEIANLFNYEANERNIEFKVIANEESLLVWFDTDKLDKILYNLIANAFKFTSSGNKITIYIAAKKINKLHEDDLDEFVEILIEDSGIGMKPEELPKIFDRFYQADTSQKNVGTGIGLALTKELIELHQGEIKVESEPGKGTRFIVLLPIGKEHLENYQLAEDMKELQTKPDFLVDQDISDFQTPISQDAVENEKSKKLPLLLVIEDHADLRLYIRHEFMNNFKISEAIDGKQGLDLALELVPDLIISDIMMPVLDGIELCKLLKTDERTSHIPVILLTARTSEEQVIEGLETGADDYVTKPFSISMLRARANNLIESRMVLRKQFSKLPDISQAITTTTLDQKFLERAGKLIDKHLGDSEFDAHQFAEEIGMSRSQLYRKIQALTGYSVNEFIRNIRLKKAAELLIKTDHNITEISYIIGFKEVTYFIKCFANYYDVSPSKYRGLQKNLNN